MEPKDNGTNNSYEVQIQNRVKKVVSALQEKLSPDKIILFSQKFNLQGQVSSFKLCLVTPTEDKTKTELDVYLAVDSAVPFDVLIYTPEEWQIALGRTNSFASRIQEGGVVLYERQ